MTSVTLKYGQVNQQCHKQAKLTKLYHQAKFDIYHTYSLQQNWNVDVFTRQPYWQPGTDHYTCRLNSFYMYASQMYLTWSPHCWQCSEFHFESVGWWHLYCTAKAPVNCSPDTATPPCSQYIILKITYARENQSNQSIFYFMSVHIEVILNPKNNHKKTTKTYNYYLY